jgi:hypothetical protein
MSFMGLVREERQNNPAWRRFIADAEQSLRLETRIDHAGLVHVRPLHILRLAPFPRELPMCLCDASTYRRIACLALLRGLRGSLGLASITARHAPGRPSENFLVMFMACFLHSGCPNWAGSRRPVTLMPKIRRDGMDATVIAS